MKRRQRFKAEWRAERALWREHLREQMRAHHAAHHAAHAAHAARRFAHHDLLAHGPWWLQARMRWRIFLGFAASLAVGTWVGHRVAADQARWWQIALILLGLWTIAGAAAWRLTRPLLVAIRAARELGEGRLDTRIATGQRGEMDLLASAINRMAEQIGQQLRDQRALLAAVSHELRTPLGHMRVLIETARERSDEPALAQLEKEVLALDDLVAKLLASSRLEFGSLDRRRLDVAALVADVALAAGVAPELIEAEGDTHAAIDPTLVRRAVANLLDNASRHGGGPVAVRVERRGDDVAVEVDDAGPGLSPERRADAFRGFVPSSGGGLGLGLTLVARIAVAHDGKAWTAERPGGGARVGFAVAVTPRPAAPAS
ncbi:MAG TPA: HAMP domain-containing sensor histidine kinase [Kofleriaceae bacterium]|nr:HAMP domain-containing sensor histidine kinase [Kofleriaceae bacterium]